MTFLRDDELNEAIEQARCSGTLIFAAARAQILEGMNVDDVVLAGLVEQRILQEASRRGIPILFA